MLSAAVFSVILAAAAAAQSFPPVDLPTTCAAVKCEPGQTCEMQDVVCVQPPCDPQPVCVNVSKAGECPVPEPSEPGICAFTCNSDSDCDGDKKCCKNGCGGTNCRSPQSLIPTTPAPTRPTCATVRCGFGKTCVMKRPRDCIGDPCYPQPYCVDIDKPGECPKSSYIPFGFFACRSQCRSDEYCPGDQKCCMAGCGKRCMDPVQTCATMKCEPGQTCEMQDVVCVRPPCDPQPVCVNVKPGECPKSSFIPYSFFACRSYAKFGIQRCWSDDYCPGDKKCCMTGCGKRCLDPVQTCATTVCLDDHKCVMMTKCNKGGCSQKPVCEPVKRCPVYPMWINPNCVPQDLCSVNDPSTCPAGTLCCSTDCGRQCVRPVE